MPVVLAAACTLGGPALLWLAFGGSGAPPGKALDHATFAADTHVATLHFAARRGDHVTLYTTVSSALEKRAMGQKLAASELHVTLATGSTTSCKLYAGQRQGTGVLEDGTNEYRGMPNACALAIAADGPQTVTIRVAWASGLIPASARIEARSPDDTATTGK